MVLPAWNPVKLYYERLKFSRAKPIKRWQFFKNIIPSYNLKIDPDSYHFYQAEDWEMLLLQTGQSPFSRRKVKETEDDAEDEDFGL